MRADGNFIIKLDLESDECKYKVDQKHKRDINLLEWVKKCGCKIKIYIWLKSRESHSTL